MHRAHVNTFGPEFQGFHHLMGCRSRLGAPRPQIEPRQCGHGVVEPIPRGAFLSKKRDRQQAILELVSSRAIASQRELEELMRERGWEVTQATLSRDLRELGVVRAHGEDGARYMPAGSLGGEEKPQLSTLLPELFSGIDGVGELLVLRTLPSGAQPIAEAIDDQGWPEILGTIGGENTILIICRSASARNAVTERLRQIAEGTA
jgi:transcriptional regulator of arginine metabolism